MYKDQQKMRDKIQEIYGDIYVKEVKDTGKRV